MYQNALLEFNIRVTQLAEIASKTSLDKDMKTLTKFLISGSRAVRKAYKEEFTEALKSKKILPKIEFISFLVNEEVKTRISTYTIDDVSGMIIINFHKESPLKFKLEDLSELLDIYFSVDPKSDLYFMMLGYFTEPENYQFIQLYNALTS